MLAAWILLYGTGLGILTRVSADAQGRCMSYTIDRKCCKNKFSVASNPLTYSSCPFTWDGVSNQRWCVPENSATKEKCLANKLPGIGNAYPLGMMSGALLQDQIIVPSNLKKRAARLYASVSWSAIASESGVKMLQCLSSLGSSVPKTAIRNAPVFIQIDFIRAKKLQYLVIADKTSPASSAIKDRKFAFSYRDMNGHILTLEKDNLYAKIFECLSMFGQLDQDCRLKLDPVRAQSVRIVFLDYKNDSVTFELGGLDYLEADHQWQMDTILTKGDEAQFPDERGNMALLTNMTSNGKNYFGDDASLFAASKMAWTAPISSSRCPTDPTLCKDGLSIAFSFRVADGSIGIILSGQGSEIGCENPMIGFAVCWIKGTGLQVKLILERKMYTATYQLADYNKWHEYAVTWSLKSGLRIFINGVRVQKEELPTLRNSTDAAVKTLRVGTGSGSANGAVIHNLRLWNFTLSEDEVAEIYSPGSKWQEVRKSAIGRFRPKNCADIFEVYGKKTGTYEIYGGSGSAMLDCVPQGNGAQFFFNHYSLPARVYGPLIGLPFKLTMNYHDSLIQIAAMLTNAKRCKQKVSYECKNSRISGNVVVLGRSGAAIQQCTAAQPCSCDTVSAVPINDTVVFEDKNVLPITSISVSNLATYNDYLHFSVGAIECYSDIIPLSCASKTRDGRCCSSSCIDSGDSYGPACTVSDGNKAPCLTEETGFSGNEIDSKTKCIFPFTYKGKGYNTCISLDDKAPWCSLSATFDGKWRYCIGHLPKADIDFSITSYDNYGDWKIGNDCSGEENSGPCDDVSASDRPKDMDSNIYQIYSVWRKGFSSLSTGGCENQLIRVAASGLSAISFDIEDPSRPNIFQRAIFDFYAPNAERPAAFVYAVIPQIDVQDDSKYISQCRYRNFRAGMYYGPVMWKKSTLLDLKDIVSPVLRLADRDSSRTLFLVFEWKDINDQQSKVESPKRQMQIFYKDKAPDNYLFADAADMKYPGMPLVYNTRYYSKGKRCLEFWYYMHEVGNSALAVNINQRGYLSRQILKIRGNQGGNWKKATVSLKGYLSPYGGLFHVSFVAVAGSGASKSIAIDNISFLSATRCTLQPADPYDVARGKATGDDLKAVDGNFATCVTVSTSKFVLDLGEKYRITNVRLTTPSSDAVDKEFKIKIGNDASIIPDESGLCVNYLGPLSRGRPVDIICKKPIDGRYFYVELINPASGLDICNVEVFSNIADNIPFPALLLPLGHSYYNLSTNVKTLTLPMSMNISIDKFGYPLFDAFFNGSSSAEISFNDVVEVSADFTFCLHFKPVALGKFRLFTLEKSSNDQLVVAMEQDGSVSLKFIVVEGNFVVVSSLPVLSINVWKYLCFLYEDHLGRVTIFVDGLVVAEKDVGLITPKIGSDSAVVGEKLATPSGMLGGLITCIQLYNTSLDQSAIQALDLCHHLHVKDACNNSCQEESVCDQITGKCICPSYANRFVTETCANALEPTIYSGHVDFISCHELFKMPGKFFSSFELAVNKTTAKRQQLSYFYVAGPVNNGICMLKPTAINFKITSQSCFVTQACATGSTLAFWFQVPQVLDWKMTGNVTLLTYGNIKIVYGVVDDLRNGTTKPIPSLMFRLTSVSGTCLWISSIYANMMTNAWSHLTITIDSSNVMNVFFNGNPNYAIKFKCFDPEAMNSNMISGGLNFTCLDELVVWNRILTKNEAEEIYKVVVFGGKQAVRNPIAIRKLTLREPDDLWAIDRSGIAYKYADENWISLPGEKLRDVHAGSTGVFAVNFQNNTLLRRDGISVQNPEGTSWSIMQMKTAFYGAIVELSTQDNGEVIAKSFYQWHCINTQTADAMKSWKPLTGSDFFEQKKSVSHYACKTYAYEQLGLCWLYGSDAKISAYKASISCKVAAASEPNPNSLDEPSVKRMSFGRYQEFPFVVRATDSIFLERKRKGRNNVDMKEYKNLAEFEDVASINGLPYGIRLNGDVFRIHAREPFLIHVRNGKCLMRRHDNILEEGRCSELFYFNSNNCLVHFWTSRIVSFHDNEGRVDAQNCENDKQVSYYSDLTMRLNVRQGQCLGKKLRKKNTDCNSEDSRFVLETVSPIKNILNFYLTNTPSSIGNADVRIEIRVIVMLRYPKWSSRFTNPSSPEAKFVCRKIAKELKQMYMGNVNYRGLECGTFSNSNCTYTSCGWNSAVTLRFAYFGEEERLVLSLPKFAGAWTDCQGLWCQMRVTSRTVGVDFSPFSVRVEDTFSKSVILRVSSSVQGKYSALRGYNLSIEGKSKYQHNWITNVRIVHYQTGHLLQIQDLEPYFAYKVTVQPLFVRGVGVHVTSHFETLEHRPTEAPGIVVFEKTRTSLRFTLEPISNVSWSGSPIGYRVYFQSLLKLSRPIDLKNYTEIEKTHDHHNFMVLKKSSAVIYGLQDFTNYSLIICAYNSYGVGPMTQVFNRTMQGEPEVPPPDFHLNVLNSTHIEATWSPMTKDIEKLNGWVLSGYAIKLKEHSYPMLSVPLKYNLIADATSLIIGPLEEAREYSVSIAGEVENRAGNFTTLCIRTEESVPTTFPNVTEVINVTSDVVLLKTGCSNMVDENGVILYYNISATNLNTNETSLYTAHIEENVCLLQNGTCSEEANACIFRQRKASVTFSDRLQKEHQCTVNGTKLSKTAFVIKHPVDHLVYWTNYSISSSLCNAKGCGPFAKPVLVRTAEHAPTCSPNVASIQNTSSTSMFISWLEIPLSCAHGVLSHYNVYFSLDTQLKGTECFNKSSCWELHNPKRKNQTKFYVTNVTERQIELPALRKYGKFCVFVQAVNNKGLGPASRRYCNYTAEDFPEGPPSSIFVKANSSTSLVVKLMPPSADVVNGIIRGYKVFYYETDESGNQLGPEKAEVFLSEENENSTSVLITGLQQFTWYVLYGLAFTAIGDGPNGTKIEPVRTLQDVPSGLVRNISFADRRSTSSVVLLQQTQPSQLNGIFAKLYVKLVENQQDGVKNTYKCYFLALNVTSVPADISRANNKYGSGAVNGTGQTNATYQEIAGPLRASGSYVIRSNAPNATMRNEANLNLSADYFSLEFGGLLPHTKYDVYISTCTKIGCGPVANSTFRTDESVPSAAPVPHTSAEIGSNFLKIFWHKLNIMDQNGIITGYKIKYMKSCEYSRLHGLPEVDDCERVLPLGTQNFLNKEVNGTGTNMTLEQLTPYTFYHCEICAKTIKGYGPCAGRKYRTDEGVPIEAPVITMGIPTFGSSFKLFWNEIALPSQNGEIIGYQIKYRLASSLNESYGREGNYMIFNVMAVPPLPPAQEQELKNLELKSNYTVKVAGMTSKGVGVFSDKFFTETGDYTNGNWSLWSQWSFCSESCGGGVSVRRRTCDNPAPFNGGLDCTGEMKQTRQCNIHICSGFYLGDVGKNCIEACKTISYYCNPEIQRLEGSTKPFEKQGVSCVDKTNAKYSKLYHPSYAASKCEGYQDIPAMINCTVRPPNDGKTQRLCDCVAPGDCGCTEWGTWSLCSVPRCGGGSKTRTRSCLTKPWCPAGGTFQRMECNVDPCPVDGSWGQWSEITPCNKSCGYGYRHRHRRCDSPPPLYKGNDCPGPSVYVIPECNTHKCPVNGNWGEWGEWRQCNSPCGNGLKLRKRYCDNPAPKYLGKDCEGSDAEWKPCNANPCEGVEVLFTIKLTDFEWKYEYVYPTKTVTQELTTTCRTNVHALYNNSAIIKNVNILNYAKGSVIANFSIFYAEVRQDEILLLQDYVMTTGKLFNLSTVMQTVKPLQVVTDPPSNVTAYSDNPFTMTLLWKPPSTIQQIVNISGYYVFYREYDSPPGKWNVSGVPGLNRTKFILRDLKANTKYRFRMTLAVTTSNGPASNEAVNTTKEGIPSVSPTELSILATGPYKAYLQWKRIPDSKYHGRRLGYQIKHKPYLESTYKIMKVPSEINEATIERLKAFTLYDFEVVAYTGAGLGPPVATVIKTPEGAPTAAPPSFEVKHGFSTNLFTATWQEIPEEFTNGLLLGYKLKYTITHVSDQAVVGAPITKEIALDKFTFFYKITGLQSYTTYEISISGYTAGGEGPYSKPFVAKTCKCPSNVFMNWYPNPPYVMNNPGNKMTGIMAELVESMIKSSCGKCGKDESKIYAYQSLSGENPMKVNEKAVKNSIGKEFHVSLPIFGYASITRYMDTHLFILFIESSGSATIVRNEVDYAAKTINAFKSIGNIWPMYLITILITGVFGIIIWAAERTGNEEFSQLYISGALQGFWWAFISMTTVGYGDITPRTIKGRVVAIIWTLAGLVLSGILLGALTSSVTSMTLPPDVKLYGTESAAINSSFEYNLGVRRNSRVNSKAQYDTTDKVLEAVRGKQVDIALLDAFTAASLKPEISAKSLKVAKLINANTGYGVVLSKEFVRLESDFRSFIASNQDKISSFTSNMTEKLLVEDTKTEEVPMLFDPSTEIFKEMLKTEGILLAICTAIGLVHSIFKLVKKNKLKVMSANEMLIKEMEMFDAAVENFEGRLNNKLASISIKHQNEMKELLRLRKSYQRHLKRRYHDYYETSDSRKYGVAIHSIGQSES